MTSRLGFGLALPHIGFENADLNTEKKNLRFRKYPATCGRSDTIRKCYVWTQIFLNTEKKIPVFEKNPATCGSVHGDLHQTLVKRLPASLE